MKGSSPDSFRAGRIRLGETLLRHYRIFGIREGGCGLVVFVTDLRSGRRFAAKTYKTTIESRPAATEFRDEAAFWIQLPPHPNLVRAHFVEMLNDRPFLFLQYVDGGPRTSLREWLHSGPVGEEQAIQWAYQFCVGMEFANKRGEFAHLDLKPENLLIDSDGILKVSDFGLAKRIRVSDVDGKYPRTNAGTWPYAAPELFSGEAASTGSDIYAFGVIFAEMLTGKLPYPFKLSAQSDEAYRQLADFHLRHNRSFVTEKFVCADGCGLSRSAATLLRCCLDPTERLWSFRDLRRLMDRLFSPCTSAQPVASLQQDDLLQQALALHRLGRHSEALRTYNRLLQLAPDVGRFWLCAAESLIAAGMFGTAAEFLEKAVLLDPTLQDATPTSDILMGLRGP